MPRCGATGPVTSGGWLPTSMSSSSAPAPAGDVAAIRGAQLGLKVAVVEEKCWGVPACTDRDQKYPL